MPNEIEIVVYNGFPFETVHVNITDDQGITLINNLALTKDANLDRFTGDMPPAASPGTYLIQFYSANNYIGQGILEWDGEAEIISTESIDEQAVNDLINVALSKNNLNINLVDDPSNLVRNLIFPGNTEPSPPETVNQFEQLLSSIALYNERLKTQINSDSRIDLQIT